MSLKQLNELTLQPAPSIADITITRALASGSGPAKYTTWETVKDLFKPYWWTDIQSSIVAYAVASGTNTYTATLSPAIASYTSGMQVRIKFTNANTGASTINLNGVGAIPLKKNVSTALTSGDIIAGSIITLNYDGTNFQLITASGTVTNVSALTIGTSGSDLTSTVANSTTTPVITLNVPTASATNRGALSSSDWATFNGKQNALSGTGIVKSTSGTISYLTDNSSNWDSAYTFRLTTLTTLGSSGASTLISNVLNIPAYTLSGLGGISYTDLSSSATGLSYNNTNGVFSLTSGYVIPTTTQETNWNTAYTNRITSATSPLGITSNVISIQQGTTTTDGYITRTDWNTFNSKQNALNGTGFVKISGTTISYDNSTYLTSLSGAVLTTTNQNIDGQKTFISGITNWDNAFTNNLNFLVSGVIKASITSSSSYYQFRSYATGGYLFKNSTSQNSLSIADTNEATFLSSVTASSFVKSGGTSSQFLKADGSVDTTTYGLGTVTSVGLSAPTGFSVSNSPIISSGTIALSFASGYSLPTTSSQTNWNTAYTNRITSLTTTGSSGASTLVSNTLNIPNYTLSGLGGQPALSGTGFVKISGTTISYDNSTYLTANQAITITATGEATGTSTASGTAPSIALTLTNSSVIGKVLTGLSITGGSIIATDSILTAFGKLQNQVTGLVGGVSYQGTWNASTNSPSLTSSSGTKGYYYVVATPGSTNLDGVTDWKLGDWAIYNGATWNKVDNTDAVISVNGYVGAVTLTTNDIGENTNLYFTPTRAQNSITLTTIGSSGASTYSSGTLNVPTYTLSGLGGQPLATNLTSLSGLTYASTSFVKMTASGTFALDTNTYLTSAVTSIATAGLISGGTITTTGTITTSMATNKLVGRSTAGTGVMEEITIGSGLSLSGGTLSASTVSGTIPHATATGTDTYAATISGVTAYNDGDAYLIQFTNGNTTTSTLNINSIGAISLYRNNDGELIGGDIASNGEMLCIYDSTITGFRLIGTSPNTLLSYITNADSVSITKGQPVYAFGGTGDRMTVKRALNTSDSTSAQTVGLVLSSSIASGQKGLILMQGLLDGLSILPTSTFADGDPIYLGATAGSITNVKPSAPNHLVYLGVVTTSSNGSAGRMYVRVQNGYELDELHDVSIVSKTDRDVLMYESATTLWKNKTLVKGDIGLGNVDNTSDVNKPVSTDTQTALNLKVDGNSAITGATKTKITYDTKGLVTAGADATTADIADSTNKRYVTDAQLVIIGNTSGTNTGDNSANSLYSGLATSKQDTLVSGTNIKTINSTSLLGSSDISLPTTSSTDTFTNKRITSRVSSVTSSATPSVNTDSFDAVTITALAATITGVTVTGTPTDFQKLIFRIKDNGTARAITWGASFEAKGVALPTTTVISKVLTVGFIYDSVSTKWGCVASAQQA